MTNNDNRHSGTGIDRTTVVIALGLAIFFAGLIGLVVIVGLINKTLDPTGTAGLLGGIFTGLVSGILILLNKKGGGGNGTHSA